MLASDEPGQHVCEERAECQRGRCATRRVLGHPTLEAAVAEGAEAVAEHYRAPKGHQVQRFFPAQIDVAEDWAPRLPNHLVKRLSGDDQVACHRRNEGGVAYDTDHVNVPTNGGEDDRDKELGALSARHRLECRCSSRVPLTGHC